MAFRIIVGDCREQLRSLPDGSVHCVVTSPPYWGLRDYGVEPSAWADGWRGVFGLEPDYQMFVDHAVEVFREVRRVLRNDGTLWLNLGDCYATGAGPANKPGGTAPTNNGERAVDWGYRTRAGVPTSMTKGHSGFGTSTLTNGGAYQAEAPRPWSGRPEPGASSTAGYGRGRPDRRGEGTSSARPPMGKHASNGSIPGFATNTRDPKAAGGIGPMTQPNRMPQSGLKPKDLVGIPWRVALALQADGWWLRRDVIWHKPNPMPESTEDRPTTSHEYLFMLTKSERYYYDAEAVAEEAGYEGGFKSPADFGGKNADDGVRQHRKSGNLVRKMPVERGCPAGTGKNQASSIPWEGATRNKRSVWTIATSPFPEAHFATFPPALVEPCVLAGTSAHGCCPDCGAGWERVTAEVDTGLRHKMPDGMATHAGGHETIHRDGREKGAPGNPVMAKVTLGFYPGCGCYGAGDLPPYPPKPSRAQIEDEAAYKAAMAAWRAECEPVTDARRALVQGAMRDLPATPAVVGDCFAGAGTVLMVAQRLGRDSVGVELNPDYAKLARGRVEADAMTKESGAAHMARAAGRVKTADELPLFAAGGARTDGT